MARDGKPYVREDKESKVSQEVIEGREGSREVNQSNCGRSG